MFSRKIYPKGLEESHPPQRHYAQVCTPGFIGYKGQNMIYMQHLIQINGFIACFKKCPTVQFWNSFKIQVT